MNLLKLFQNETNLQAYAAGQTIFAAGEPGTVMYVILTGQVAVDVNGRAIETIEPGGILGELALVDRNPRSANAVARTACTLAAIDERRFTFLVQETPFFALHVMGVMAGRLRRQTA